MKNLSLEKIIFIVMFAAVFAAGWWVGNIRKKIERPGVDCPSCGSVETLVTGKLPGETKCLCPDCGQRFSILDSTLVKN